MVLPLTAATVPRPPRPPSCACGHWPLPAGLTRTVWAVTGPLGALSRVGRIATQLPAVTSDSWAGSISEIAVWFVKSIVAVEVFCVTCIVLPDTDAMSPSMRSPGLFGLAVVAGPEGDAFAVVAGAGVLDELHRRRRY